MQLNIKFVIMELSEYALSKLVDYIRGEGNITLYKSGNALVDLFNKYGTRDLYDFKNGGLPKLDARQTMNTSRKDYTFDRLKKINKSSNLKRIIEDVINEDGVQNIEQVVTGLNALLVKEGYMLEPIGGDMKLSEQKKMKKLKKLLLRSIKFRSKS